MTITKLGLDDFERLLDAWEPRRQITEIHLHHTYIPDHLSFRGEASVLAMRRFHMQEAGMIDIAQHLTVDPGGGLWTGRPFDTPPASIAGHNGNARRGPFMIEMVGNFDKDRDTFKGPQEKATQAVILALLRKFDLAADAVVFHNERSTKTCPGTTINPTQFRAKISALLTGAEALALDATSDATLDSEGVRRWSAGARAASARAATATRLAEPSHAEVPEARALLERQAVLTESTQRSANARSLDFDVQPLLPHIVNLSKGLLSVKGEVSTSVEESISTTTSSLRMITEHHLPAYIAAMKAKGLAPKLMIHAHGGLVSEADALAYANAMTPWWQAHDVYPIYFIWESSWLDALRDAPRGDARATGRSVGDWLIEGALGPFARSIWNAIKTDAENASNNAIAAYDGQAGGAYQFAQHLRPLLKSHPELELHAVGHSTGPILLSLFTPLLTTGTTIIKTLSHLAPAMRTDVFKARVVNALNQGKVENFAIYTMTDAAERQDSVALLYRKSLLYFVRNACEDRDDGRILGLACDLLADRDLVNLFGITDAGATLSYVSGNTSLEFAPLRGVGEQNKRTAANAHSDFDNDAATMMAVLQRVLGRAPTIDSAAKRFPSNPRGLRSGSASANTASNVPASNPTTDRYFGDEEEVDSAPGGAASTVPNPVSTSTTTSGRRAALCIGINDYRVRPLEGCVNDSLTWARVLQGHGFNVRTLHDKQATRAQILASMRALITGARRGDEIVIQFAGHGTQLPDTDNDEIDSNDEALVPHDHEDGLYVLDDDIHELTAQLAEGATLTIFMDCCHSGTNSRAAKLNVPAPTAKERVRYLPLNDDARARYLSRRKSMRRGAPGGMRSAVTERNAPAGVVQFSACIDHENAWESNGQGDFTRLATPLLQSATGLSNQAFIQQVNAAFSGNTRQHPLLLPPAGNLASRKLLGLD